MRLNTLILNFDNKKYKISFQIGRRVVFWLHLWHLITMQAWMILIERSSQARMSTLVSTREMIVQIIAKCIDRG
jgi:hypothetical protein